MNSFVVLSPVQEGKYLVACLEGEGRSLPFSSLWTILETRIQFVDYLDHSTAIPVCGLLRNHSTALPLVRDLQVIFL